MECNISKSTETELTLCTIKILSHTRGRFLASVAYDQHYGTIYKPLKFLVFNVMEFFMFRKKEKRPKINYRKT